MPNLSIKDVPEPLAESLRLRAARNHRSLQGELMAILEAALQSPSVAPAPSVSSAAGLSFAEAASAFRRTAPVALGDAGESASLLREMRDARHGVAP